MFGDTRAAGCLPPHPALRFWTLKNSYHSQKARTNNMPPKKTTPSPSTQEEHACAQKPGHPRVDREVQNHATTTQSWIVVDSFMAGLFGALASVFGKLAFSSNSILVTFLEDKCPQVDLYSVGGELACTYVVYLCRVLMFVIMGWVNAMMFHFAFKAMNTEGSLSGTVTTTSCNFVFTALLGYFLFREELSLMWFVGAACIAIGVCLVTMGKDRKAMMVSKKKK